MSSLILNVKSSSSGGSGGGDITEDKNESANKAPIVLSAAVHVSSEDSGGQQDGTTTSTLNSIEERISPTSVASAVQSKTSISPVNYSASSVANNSTSFTSLSKESNVVEDNVSQSSKAATLATVVVTAPPQTNTSSPLQRQAALIGTLPVSSHSAATVITAVPPVSVKPLPMTTLTQQLPQKLPQQPSKVSAVLGSKNNQTTVQTNQSTTVIGQLRNSIQPPISFSAVSRPHQLTIPNVNHGKQSSPSPTITLSPIKQGPPGATLVTAIQSSQAHHTPSGTVLVSNNATGTGTAILTTHRQLHTVTTQPQRQLHQTIVQPASNVARVTPTLIAGHAPGAHHHVVQHHPPPLRMVQIPAGAGSVAGGSQNITRIAVSGSGSISSHVPPTTVSLPQSPAPITIRHALPQSPLARASPGANSGACSQLSKSPVRHLQPQLPQNPVGGNNQTTLLTTSRSVHSAPPAHLSSASIITHHPQQSGSTVVNRTALPLASVLASANQQRQLQQQLVTQRVLSTGPGGTTAAVVQGIQQPHPGLNSHSLSQTGTGTIMVNPHRPGTISMLPQVPASGTITAGGLIVHHPSSGGNLLGNSNPSQGHHSIPAGSHQLVSFPSNNGQTHTSSHQRITLPAGNVLAHINGSQQHGSVLAVTGAVTSSGGNISSTSITSNVNGRQIVANTMSKSSTTILPPNALQQLLASHPHPQQSEDDLDVSEVDGQNVNFHQSSNSAIIGITRGGTGGMAITTGRPTVSLPSPRQQPQVNQQRDRRSLPCQLALQDHNYFSRPPPTPPPPSQSPPILRDVLQEQQRRQQQLHQSLSTNSSSFNSVLAAAEVHLQQQQLSPGTKQAYVVGNSLSTTCNSSTTSNRSAFSPPLQTSKTLRSPSNTVFQNANSSSNYNDKSLNGRNSENIVRLPQYTPDSQKIAAAMVAAVTSPPVSGKRNLSHSGHSSIAAGVNGPISSDSKNNVILGKNNAPHRVDTHFKSIQEAGVGPMAPLVDETPSDGDSVSPTQDIDREYNGQDPDNDGEETETAPEDVGEDDSITRCICDFLHDDGYMICCDKCLVWQHVVCMGLDRNNIPDEYLCEVCEPRPVDRKRAKAMQARRRSELYHHSSSSDESSGNRSFKSKNKLKGAHKTDKKNSTKPSLANMKKILDKKVDRVSNKDFPNKKTLHSKVSKKTAAQALSMLNNKTNQSSFASSAMIPQQLLPSNLLENNLNVMDGHDDNILSPLSPLNTNSKFKKQYRKRKPSDKDLKKGFPINDSAAFSKDRRKSQQLKKQINRNRIRSIDSDGGDDLDASTDEENPTIEEVPPDASQQLRSWVDQYEEAVTNHYSPELRARLAGVGKWGGISNGDLKPSVIGSVTRCNVSLQGNGVKILTASSNLSTNTPIIECKGKLMLAAQYRSVNRKSPSQIDSSNISINPYVFFYQLSNSLEICLDGKTYGNDSRFCRRSANDHNAELRHFIDKGSLHLFIITRKSVEKNQEILLPPDSSCLPQLSSPLPSINADLREITMKGSKQISNGISSPTGSLLSGRSSDVDESTPLSTTRNRPGEHISNKLEPDRQKTGKEKRKFPKLVMKSPKKTKSAVSKENKSNPNSSGKKNKIRKGLENQALAKNKKMDSDKIDVKVQSSNSAEDTDAGQESTPTSPTKYGSAKPSPGKLGLPDNSGLIVGVNTINYDASSELKNKAKSREERKMEMIMKAFEAMEKAEQRKKEGQAEGTVSLGGHQSVRGSTDSDKSSSNHKRRRSSAKDVGKANADSNVDASSAEDMANDDTDDGDEDESSGKKKLEKNKKKFTRSNKGRKTGPNTPKRRRSRISSGGSLSGKEEISINTTKESIQDSSSGRSSNTASSQNGPFRFPKTKKSMMSDWLQEANEISRSPNPTFCDDDDVSANYLKGSRSPPGIAMHLLRSSIGSNATTAPLSPNIQSPHSPVKSGGNHGCSAKKRWLRQAISEDHAPGEIMSPAHEVAFMTNGNSPGSSGESAAQGEPANFTISDYVTPLKKRRIQSYKDEQKFLEEEANASSEEGLLHPSKAGTDSTDFVSKISTSYNSYSEDVKIIPNGIKKKLLHNLVLEAVLDRAMEDMLNVRPKTEANEETAELEISRAPAEGADAEKERLVSAEKVENDNTDYENQCSNHVKEEKMEEDIPEEVRIGLNIQDHSEEEKKNNEVEATIEQKATSNQGLSNNDNSTTIPSILQTNVSSSSIPEPSSVFKSFFKPSISIEALEAQIEENKRLREAEQKQLEQLTAKQKEEEMASKSLYSDAVLEEKSNMVPEQCELEVRYKDEAPPITNEESAIGTSQYKSERKLSFSTQSNIGTKFLGERPENIESNFGTDTESTEVVIKEKDDKENSVNTNDLKTELEFPENSPLDTNTLRPMNDNATHILNDFQEEQEDSQHSSNTNILNESGGKMSQPSFKNDISPTQDTQKPKEKRKVSLADYKRRRQQQQQTTVQIEATFPELSKYSSQCIENQKQSTTNIISQSAENLNSEKIIDIGSFDKSRDIKPEVSPLMERNLKETKSNVPDTTQLSFNKVAEATILKEEAGNDEIGGSTPTMDEEQITPASTLLSNAAMPDVASLPATNAPITLNPLPLFEKLEKLEKAQKENKKKAMGNVSPPPEPKREDLTERLKKEFGLTVDGDEDDDTPISEEDSKQPLHTSNANINEGDATPEEDSPNAPPGSSGATLSSIHRQPTMTRLPDQIAQYPIASTSSYTSSVSQSIVESNTTNSSYPSKGQYSSSYTQNTHSGQTSRYSSHHSQQIRSSYQHSSGSYSQSQQHSYQRHSQPPSRSHLPVNHPGSRMTYPPPLPPASVIANAPHPNKINSDRDIPALKSSNSFKRSNSSKEKDYYSQQHTWSAERDNRGDRDRESRGSSSGSRSYYASTNSRGASDRSIGGSRSISSGSYGGDKMSSREYNRREYSQIRSGSSSDRSGSHIGSSSLGTDRDLRGGGSDHGSSSSRSTSNSSRSKSSYSRNYYN